MYECTMTHADPKMNLPTHSHVKPPDMTNRHNTYNVINRLIWELLGKRDDNKLICLTNNKQLT